MSTQGLPFPGDYYRHATGYLSHLIHTVMQVTGPEDQQFSTY